MGTLVYTPSPVNMYISCRGSSWRYTTYNVIVPFRKTIQQFNVAMHIWLNGKELVLWHKLEIGIQLKWWQTFIPILSWYQRTLLFIYAGSNWEVATSICDWIWHNYGTRRATFLLQLSQKLTSNSLFKTNKRFADYYTEHNNLYCTCVVEKTFNTGSLFIYTYTVRHLLMRALSTDTPNIWYLFCSLGGEGGAKG